MSEFKDILLNGTSYMLGGGSGLTADIKAALLQIAQKVAYIDDDGQTYYDALENALYPPADLVSISAVYAQSGTVYDTDTLDSLKSDLVVTAHMSDSTTQTITGYTLSGTLAEGTSTITVSYGGKTTTFTVTVTHYEPVTVAITWTGYGGEKTSSVIDATQLSVYFTLPFEEGSPYLADGATADAGGFKILDAFLYDDSEATTVVGYYQWDNQTVSETGRTIVNSPGYDLGTTILAAPSGYYVKLRCIRVGETMFTSNGNVLSYLNAYGTSVIMQ